VFGPVHHIGYRVSDIDGAIAHYQKNFDGRLVHRETIQERGIEIAFVQMGEALVEFIRNLSGDNPDSVTIDHVAFQVPDIEAALATCRQRGLTLLDERPRLSSAGYKVAFLAPEAGKGARLQLVQLT
jgi:methylmalonyl-CoA/ethylmalonyl-CoA epimerase